MRVLFIDICAQFINATRNLLPAVIGLASDMVCYGPGYVDSKRLSGGIKKFIEEEGPFDLLLPTPHAVFGDLRGAAIQTKSFNMHYAHNISVQDLALLKDVATQIDRSSCPRIGIFLESDFYNFSEEHINRIKNRTEAVIAMGTQFIREAKELPNLKHEAFKGGVTDAWIEHAKGHQGQIANLAHIVGEHEFNYTALALRKHAWSLMGVNYFARESAYSQLKSAGLEPKKDGPMRKIIAVLKRARIIEQERSTYLNYTNSDFRNRLASARYSYTCGSGLDMPIRKFVEIPAAGAVLVCRPFSGFRDAGYIDQENAIVCDPKDIVEVHKWLESDPSRAQCIANEGRAMVLKNHSVKARARQFKKIFESVIDGTFSGGVWERGSFKINRNQN